MKYDQFSSLVGETIVKIDGGQKYSDSVTFHTESGKQFVLQHVQDCCETVRVEDIAGDLNDLIGKPILKAEESSNRDNPPSNCCESFTWTFYILATVKGYVTIRWLGESNGYYSESVSFFKCS